MSTISTPAPPIRVKSREERLYEALLEISNLVGSVLELRDILDAICPITARAMETDTCSVYLREHAVHREEPATERLVLRATHGLRKELVDEGAFLFGQGIPGWAAKANTTVTVPDCRKDKRYAPLDDGPDENFVAYLCVPMRVQDEVIGVLSIRRREPTEWTEEDVYFAEIIAKQVAIVVEKARLYLDKIDAERLAAIAISLSETAHSIKNLLQGMTGGAYFLERGLAKDDLELVNRGWELLKRNQAKIARLVVNMLSFSRSGELHLEEGVDLNDLMRAMILEVRDSAEFRNVSMDDQLDPKLPSLRIDRDALQDALLNLITNAIDAIPEAHGEGMVKLTTQFDPARRKAVIQIIDNGSGIPEEAKKKMFQLFFTTKGNHGTGIGLCVTKKIIEEHGGKIWFTSEVDAGTTFTVELPAG